MATRVHLYSYHGMYLLYRHKYEGENLTDKVAIKSTIFLNPSEIAAYNNVIQIIEVTIFKFLDE